MELRLAAPLPERHRARMAALDLAKAAVELATVSELTATEAQVALTAWVGEVAVGFQLISPAVRPKDRVLMVGSGIGLVDGLLAHDGVDVFGIEPGDAMGFSTINSAGGILRKQMTEPMAPPHPLAIEDVHADKHGTFDLIASTNVIEHLPDLRSAFAHMASLLSPGGRMIHLCANYRIPYEPHFGLPLVPGAPQLARTMFPARVAKSPGLWDSLNFVTAGDVKRYAKESGLQVTFLDGAAESIVDRLAHDPEFARRHNTILGRTLRVAAKNPILRRAVTSVPPAWMTPMIAYCEK